MTLKPLYTGYKNAFLRTDKKIEQEAKRRLVICKNCPLRKITLGIERCSHCGCPLSALVRQNDKICSKWIKKINPQKYLNDSNDSNRKI